MIPISIRALLASVLLIVALLVIAACDEIADDDNGAADDAVVEVSDDAEQDDTVEVEPTEVPAAEEPTPTSEPEPTATPDPTPEPEPTATPGPEPSEPGTRENPIPFGEAGSIGDWEIRVVDTTPDATQAVLDENMFNDPPVEGRQFFIARIEATYVGDESSDFWLDVRLRALDDGGVVYEGMESRCGVIPDNIDDRGEAFPGATIEGNTCWSVNSDLTDSLLMIAEPLFSFNGERVFFALSDS